MVRTPFVGRIFENTRLNSTAMTFQTSPSIEFIFIVILEMCIASIYVKWFCRVELKVHRKPLSTFDYTKNAIVFVQMRNEGKSERYGKK